MQTITEIRHELTKLKAPNDWTKELEADSRVGVRKLLASWQKSCDKMEAIRLQHQEKIGFDVAHKKAPTDLVAGIDEAGRGPLAGPVVTAAVVFKEYDDALIGINDSKILSREKRNAYAQIIKQHAFSFSIHIQPSAKIDELNIYEATKMSMTEAVKQLGNQPDVLLVDAMSLPLRITQHSIIKGDAKSLAIAAASILAKTARDDLMDELDKLYPHYHFSKNAGYGTALHLDALNKYGPTPIHRRSFEPVKSMMT